MASRSLHRHIARTMSVTGALLILIVGTVTHMLAERQERVVWHALLELEVEVLAAQLERGELRPPGIGRALRTWTWPSEQSMPASVPEHFRHVGPRIDDDIYIDDKEYAAVVRSVGSRNLLVVLDITPFERQEDSLMLLTAAVMLFMILMLRWSSGHLADHLLLSLRQFSSSVQALNPVRRGERLDPKYLELDFELAAVGRAIDRYLERLDGFVQREHEFIASASHELRTPVAVIAGAAEILRDKAGDDPRCAALLARIEQGVVDLDETLSTLLYLATEPDSAPPGEATCLVDEMLPGLVRDHEHLLAGKPQRIVLGAVEPTAVHAPARMVYIAIGNLLRNAIQHGHAGSVTVSLTGGVLRIVDEGPGMTPEQIAQAYSAGARHASSGRAGGLGLHIVQRIAQRQGWTLGFDSEPGRGTVVTLDFRVSKPA